MDSDYTVLAVEIDSLRKRENEMYSLYSALMKRLDDPILKQKIKIIRDQGLGHIKMVTQIASILGEEMTKG